MMTLFLAAVIWPASLQDPAALAESAAQLASERRFDEAEKLWLRALALNPGFFPAAFNLGFLNYNRQQPVKAEQYLRQAARIRPDDFNTRYVLGLVLTGEGRREAGLREWREAVRINPKHVKLMQVMAVEYSKGHYFREAASIARRALDLSPDDQNAYFIALKACQDAQDIAAVDIARRALAHFPDSARANFEYAFHLQRAGRTGEALPLLKRAMELDPTYEEPHFFYGELMAREEKYEEAAVHLHTALRIRPDYVAASMLLVKSLLALDRVTEAKAELERIVAVQPEHPQPHLLLSQLYFRLGDEDRARQEKDRSMRLRRANPALMEAPQAIPFPESAQR